jgi:VWFA-related protein
MLEYGLNLRQRRTAAALFIAAAIITGALFGAPLAGSAQQTPAATQQRPRRVGNGTPAPSQNREDSPPANQTSLPEEVGEDEVVRVETQLVTIPLVVTDRAGRLLANLRADSFLVFEDGRPQKISAFATTEAPFEVALLLDTSGSTRADVSLIRSAANAFINALRPGDRVALLAFNTAQGDASQLADVEIVTQLTSDREALREGVERIGSSNGTPFYDALEKVAKEVFGQPPAPELRGRRALVALTDGVDSSSAAEYATARNDITRQGIACYFIQINTEDFVEDRLLQDCADDGSLRLSRTQLQRYRQLFLPRADAADYSDFCRLGQFQRMQISRELYRLARKEMDDLARVSGGKTFPTANLQDARRAFAQVAQEIGTQYSLGYYPTNKARDGSFRRIRIEVKGVAGAQVRAREGYYAPKG